MHVEIVGSGPRLVLVHGSVAPGWATWARQRPLAERFTLVVPVRGGYPPNPPLAAIDFEQQADELAALLVPGDHVVAHSYGAVVALLAAARRPDALRSLVVVEPAAFAVARGDPAVEEYLAAIAEAPREPRAYLEFFLPLVGSELRLPAQLGPELEARRRVRRARGAAPRAARRAARRPPLDSAPRRALERADRGLCARDRRVPLGESRALGTRARRIGNHPSRTRCQSPTRSNTASASTSAIGSGRNFLYA